MQQSHPTNLHITIPELPFICKVVRKHFFKDRIYILQQTINRITMTYVSLILTYEDLDSTVPKYQMQLSDNPMFQWIVKNNFLVGFQFPYRGKQKDFFGCQKDLLELKSRLGQLAIYSKMTNHYIYVNTLESGSFGQVTINECKYTKKKCAIKHIQLNGKKDQYQQIENEIKILRHLKGPLLLSIYEVYKTDLYYQIVTEFIEGDNLKQIINNKLEKITRIQILDIMQQLFEALWNLHKQNILHRDVKPANIMYHDNKLKLIDFGLACFDGRQLFEHPNCGTEGYAAPEIVNVNQTKINYDFKVDVFSAGCVLYKLLTGCRLVQKSTQSKIQNNYVNKELSQLFDLVKILTRQNSLDRPSSLQAIEIIQQIRECSTFDVNYWYNKQYQMTNSNNSYQTASTARIEYNVKPSKSTCSFNSARGYTSGLAKTLIK